MLCLLFHPFLIVEFHIVPVLTADAMGFSNTRRIVCQICVTIIAVIFRHRSTVTKGIAAILDLFPPALGAIPIESVASTYSLWSGSSYY